MGKEHRGFASMDKAKVREIARKGGLAAHAQGVAHIFTHEEAVEAGRKGGAQTYRNRTGVHAAVPPAPPAPAE